MPPEEYEMNRLRVLLSKLSGLFRKARLEQQLDDDVRAHLEMLTEENLRRGMNPEEARYAALRQFGNVSSMKEAASVGASASSKNSIRTSATACASSAATRVSQRLP
jgi:hypothetical protein